MDGKMSHDVFSYQKDLKYWDSQFRHRSEGYSQIFSGIMQL